MTTTTQVAITTKSMSEGALQVVKRKIKKSENITLHQHLMILLDDVSKNPKMLDMPLIYSHDDEGNQFQFVQSTPSQVGYWGSDGEYVDLKWENDGRGQDFEKAIIIN